MQRYNFFFKHARIIHLFNKKTKLFDIFCKKTTFICYFFKKQVPLRNIITYRNIGIQQIITGLQKEYEEILHRNIRLSNERC